MAELTETELLLREEAPVQTPFGGAATKQFTADDKREQKQLDASVYDKSSAMIDEFARNSWAIEAAVGAQKSMLISSMAPEDKNFKNNDDMVTAMLRSLKLPEKYRAYLRQSKSQLEMNIKAQWAMSEVKEDELINNTIGELGRTTSVVAGAVISPELALGIGVGGVYGASASVAKVAMWEGAAETFIAVGRYNVDEKYSVADGFIDVIAGTAIASGLSKILRPRSPDEVHAEEVYVNSKVEDILAKEYKWYSDPISVVEAEAKRIDVERATINRNAFFDTQRAMNENPDYIEAKTTLRAAKKKIKDEYATNINKIDTETKGLSEIITKETDALAELVSGGKATSRQLKIRQNRIDNTQKKINDLEESKLHHNREYNARLRDNNVRSKDLDTPRKPKTEAEARLEEQVTKMSVNIENTASALRDLIRTNDKKFITEYNDAVEQLAKDFPEEFNDIRDLFRSKINNKAFHKTNTFKKMTSKQKKLLLASGVLLTGTGALADNGEGSGFDIVNALLLLIIGIALGPKLIDKIANIKNANIRQSLNDSLVSLGKAHDDAVMETSVKGKLTTGTGKLIADTLHTQITSTVAPFIKEGGESKRIMTDLLYSAEFGAGAETIKHNWFRSSTAKLITAENKAYKLWKSEKGYTGFKNLFTEEASKSVFREEVTDAIDSGKKVELKSISDFLQEVEPLRKHMWDVNKEYETLGFDKINYDSKNVSRLWKQTAIHEMFRGMSDDSKMAVQGALESAIAKTGNKQAKATAKEFVDSWNSSYKPAGGIDGDGVLTSLMSKGVLKDDVDVDDVLDAITGYSDRTGRAKYRIDFNVHDFAEALDGLQVDIHGVPVKLKLNMFIDRDFRNLMDKMSNSLYGSAALSSRGYTSMRSLTEQINNGITDKILNRKAHQVAELVVGKPSDITDDFIHNVSNITKDLTIFGKLVLVAFSTPTEVIQTLGNMNIFRGTKEIYKSFVGKVGEDSALANQLKDISGLGRSYTMLDFSHYGYSDDMVDLTDSDVLSAFRNGSMRLRDATIMISQLANINDILQGANQIMNAEKFAKLIHGIDTGMNKDRFISFGITQESIDMFDKNMFSFNSKGNLQTLDMDKFSIKQKDKFSEILYNMNQQYTPETTIGETPLFAKTNDFGRMITSLTMYSLQQFNVHGLNDLRTLDRIGMMHMMGGVGGTYLGLNARYAVQGKEIDDEQLILYSFMNSPQMLGAGAIKSMLQPAVVDTTASMLNFAGMGR